MTKEVADLKRRIDELEEELAASLMREEMMRSPIKTEGGLKQQFKTSKIGRVVADPNNKLGKLARLPRTTYRILRNPKALKDIMELKGMGAQKQNNAELPQENNDANIKGNAELILNLPVKYFFSDDDVARINLVIAKAQPELMRVAIEVANTTDRELRVITYDEGSASMKYHDMTKKKQIPKAKKISFYSPVEQGLKGNIFELEIGKNDIFITEACRND